MFKIVYVILFLSLLLNACNNAPTSKPVDKKQADTIIPDENSLGSALSTLRNEPFEEDTTLTIMFREFSFLISRMVVYDENNLLDVLQETDTVRINAELGETIEGQILSVLNNRLDNVIVEMRYETSVSISGEGPHLDLYDWKHYNSPWKKLDTINMNKFMCVKYTREDDDKFPDINIEELKEKVKEDGDRWYQLISSINSQNQYPSTVGISRYFLRISGKRKDSEQILTKIIIIKVPMGC